MLTLLSDSRFNFIVKSQECQSANKTSQNRQTLSSENCFCHSFLKLRKARKEERRKKEKGVFIRKSVTLHSLLDKNKHFSAPNCGFLFSTPVFPDTFCLPLSGLHHDQDPLAPRTITSISFFLQW